MSAGTTPLRNAHRSDDSSLSGGRSPMALACSRHSRRCQRSQIRNRCKNAAVGGAGGTCAAVAPGSAAGEGPGGDCQSPGGRCGGGAPAADPLGWSLCRILSMRSAYSCQGLLVSGRAAGGSGPPGLSAAVAGRPLTHQGVAQPLSGLNFALMRFARDISRAKARRRRFNQRYALVPLLLGTGKASVGHGEAVSGVSGLLKAAQVMRSPSPSLPTFEPRGARPSLLVCGCSERPVDGWDRHAAGARGRDVGARTRSLPE